ncbi:hypothetical protein MJ904_09460 [Massilia sp. MB5]|uniref:hypothetical protein n=1 Tax=Massilia sp. MB5 TaxID=2919578 RepID=UPI001F1172B0|nr:hypothetical protein [Massilia sp. MB5]UMR32369.1 hypothetical protein MJ904_09460 [Massilia sp. MB5]
MAYLTFWSGLAVAVLAGSTAAAAPVADGAPSLAVIKALALAPEEISAKAVSQSLRLALDAQCGQMMEDGAALYWCNYLPRSGQPGPIRFRQFSSSGKHPAPTLGGTASWTVDPLRACLTPATLSAAFGVAASAARRPAAQDALAGASSAAPLVHHEFVMLSRQTEDVYIAVASAGDCAVRIDLYKSSFHH